MRSSYCKQTMIIIILHFVPTKIRLLSVPLQVFILLSRDLIPFLNQSNATIFMEAIEWSVALILYKTLSRFDGDIFMSIQKLFPSDLKVTIAFFP